jgi:hypothetical protein
MRAIKIDGEQTLKKFIRWAVIVIFGAFILIQLGQPDRSAPPIDPVMTIAADSGFTQPASGLIRIACFDCHSNETRWPWYSYVAPASWLVANDVMEGRSHLNFSEWGKYSKSKKVLKLGQIYEQVSKGEMPLQNYLYLHADGRLTAAQRDTITSWTEKEQEMLTGN